MTHQILRLPAVKTCTGLSRSTIYLRISEGTFPAPVALGGRAVGWIEAEIQAWLEERIQVSRKTEMGCHPHSLFTKRHGVKADEE